MQSYELTNLWQSSLGLSSEDSSDSKAAEKLRSTFEIFRERVGFLVAKVQEDFPDLTIHNQSHLDALWETADVICGYGYPINPLEGFVLGGAILLHDSALSFEAYEGVVSLRRTPIWSDLHSLNLMRGISPDQAAADADFAAVRYLHAEQAKELAQRAWTTSEGDDLYLIESSELRKHYASVIGAIAASHHLSVDELQSILPPQLNSPASMPRHWRVDPIKIACILRCADAAHIDERRAPDFLRALIKAKGLSAEHWKAQNWLQRADIDTSDQNGDALLITSSKPFKKEDSAAWWVAFDAISLINKELRKSNDLLNRRAQREFAPPFALKRVTGADDPNVASNHISVEGWVPKQVEVHISDVEKLVENLGGSQLYSEDERVVVIRELIQNARDAIQARRLLEPGFSGSISVTLENNGGWYLSVTDDGVGMSESVLTGDMLDFGSSFWNSNKIASEFPGLASKGMVASGRFGIGFYSVFMICDSVSVLTRRWDAARDSSLELEFPTGLSMRPLLTRAGLSDLLPRFSTQVRVKIKEELNSADIFVVDYGYDDEPAKKETIENYLPKIVGGLDVDVSCSYNGRDSIVHKAHKSSSTFDERVAWLRNLVIARGGDVDGERISEAAKRLRFVGRADDGYGLASLSKDLYENYGLQTINRLASQHGDHGAFHGFIDYDPSSASRLRVGRRRAPAHIFQAWLDEQVTLLDIPSLTRIEKFALCCSIADLRGAVPLELVSIPVIRSGDDGAEFLERGSIEKVMSSKGLAVYFENIQNDYMAHFGPQEPYSGIPVIDPGSYGRFLTISRPDKDGAARWTVYGAIEEIAVSMGKRLNIETVRNAAEGKIGPVHVDVLTLADIP